MITSSKTGTVKDVTLVCAHLSSHESCASGGSLLAAAACGVTTEWRRVAAVVDKTANRTITAIFPSLIQTFNDSICMTNVEIV